jgi:hypothetical protein
MNTPSSIASPEAGPATANSDAIAKSVIDRYRNAYLVARAITGLGRSVKFIAITLFMLFVGAGIYISTQPGVRPSYCIGAVLLGVVVGLPLYILGILVAANGELLKATLDTAVHSTPFLTRDQQAIAMSLSGAKGEDYKLSVVYPT